MAIAIPIIMIAMEAFSIYMALTSKPPVGGSKLSDLQVTASTYGSPIKEGWGAFRIGGNILWSSNLIEHKESGGKGFGGPTAYQYTWTGAIGLLNCDQQGPITDVLRIWADTKLVFDKTGQTNGSGSQFGLPQQSGKGGNPSFSGQGPNGSWYNNVGTFRIYTGTETQMPDAAMEHLFGASNCNANRGQAYIVFDNINLINYGNRVPNFTFEVAASGTAQNQLAQAITWDASDTTVGTVDSTQVAVDSLRQQAYFFCTSGATSQQGIKVVDLTTRKEVRWATMAQIGISGTWSSVWMSPVIGLDGYLYLVQFEGSNGSPILKIDPDALVQVGSFGLNNSNLGLQTTGFITCKTLLPFQSNGNNYLACVSAVAGFPYVGFINTDTMEPVIETLSGINILSPIVHTSDSVLDACSANQLSATSCQLYFLGHPNYGAPSTTTINLYSGVCSFFGTQGNITFSQVDEIHPSDIDSAWVHFDGVSPPIFDQTDGNLLIFFQDANDSLSAGHYHYYITKINSSDGAEIWKTATVNPGSSQGTINGIPNTTNFYQYQVANGNLAWIDVGSNHQVFLVETQGGGMQAQSWAGLGATGQAWADTVGAILFWGDLTNVMTNQWGVLVVDAALSDEVALTIIVSDICAKVGLNASQIDVSALEGLFVEGYLIEQQMNAVDALRPLALAYTFDCTESDGKLKFVVRGGASKVTIPPTDFAYMEKKLNTLIEETRQQETDLPNQISITFLDPNRDFQSSVQYFRRPSQPFPVMFSKNPRTEQLPIVMQPTFAKQLAEKLLFSAWVNRMSFKAKLPWRYLPYDTTDPLTLTLPDGTTVLSRTTSINIGADLTIEYMGVAEQNQVYSPNSNAYGGLFPQNLLIPPSATRLFLMDMPLLRDQDDTGQSYTILYYALGGYNSNWLGGSMLSSTTGNSFELQGTIPAPGVTWGICTNQLGDVDDEPAPFALDTTNTINVAMTIGGSNLSSTTLTGMCNGANAAAIINTATGNIEIIQFQTAVQNADGTYTLSLLARGRRGTEVYQDSHAAGDIFILLTTSGMLTANMNLAQLNVSIFYEALSQGQSVNQGAPIRFADSFKTLWPYAPVHVKATTSSSDIAISWLRRTRVGHGATFAGGQTRAPLSESQEVYSVDIYDPTATTVLRTLTSSYALGSSPTSPGVTYTNAEYTADFGSKPASINMIVYQVSGVVGRGFGTMYNVVVDAARGTP